MTTTIHIAPDKTGGHDIKFQSADPLDFRVCVDTLKSFVEVPNRSYNPDTKTWNVSVSGYESLTKWISYICQTIDADFKWSQPPPPRQPKRTGIDPYAALHLLPTAPPSVVKAAYRALATAHHPDKGGDVVAMQNINRAYAQLTR
jgi:DnaJ-domain-containing protein 1